jgi:hypothetical protein
VETAEGLGAYGVPVELLDTRSGIVDALDELRELAA